MHYNQRIYNVGIYYVYVYINNIYLFFKNILRWKYDNISKRIVSL